MQSQNPKTSIILYDDRLELRLDSSQDTIWASLDEIAHIFGRDKSVISRHIKNIFQENELDKNQVVAKNATTAKDGKIYQVDYYNLDMILSIGYRVNSKVATWFRQWATNRLKEYLIHGYTINHNRLKELQKTIELISLQKENPDLSLSETRWLLDIISNYTESFLLLDRFDSGDLSGIGDDNITYTITYEDAKNAISQLKETLIDKKEDTGLFWNEKDDQFIGILRSIIVTFDGKYLYPTIEEQAAHLLYFIIKDHPFSDGNKRIGAFLFIWFLEKNHHRFRKNGAPKINESGLVALAILVATSPPTEKDIMTKLIINLINHS